MNVMNIFLIIKIMMLNVFVWLSECDEYFFDPKDWKLPKGAFGPLDQPACFGAGCYIETVPAQWTRTRQGWKRILGEKQAVARKRKELPEIGGCQNDRNFGAVADVDSVFSVDGRKRAVSAVFRALGGQNGTFTFWCSPRRSDAPGDPSAPSWFFFNMIKVVY